MPLFDGIALSDKHAVVLDIGHRYTKFGFAGEPTPRCIIPTEVGGKGFIQDYANVEQLYASLVEFLHTLYFKHVLVSPKDRRVVVVESLLCPTLLRDALAKVLFRHFEVSSVLFVPSHPVSLCTLGLATGLVIDVGYQEAVLIPVYEGVPVLSAWQAQPIGFNAVQKRLRDNLAQHYSTQTPAGDGGSLSTAPSFPDNIIEDIIVRGCFVTSMERSGGEPEDGTSRPPVPDLPYRIAGSEIVTIPGRLRETCFEVLFERDGDHLSLPDIILDAIIHCPIDMRRPLASNIVVIGGTSMAPGFKRRLLDELKGLAETDRYKDRIKVNRFKFHSTVVGENYTAWLGGAIFGATDAMSVHSLTREAYVTYKSVPDWSSLVHNRLPAVQKKLQLVL